MDNIVFFFYFIQKQNEHHTFLGRKKEMSPTFANRRFRAKKIRTEIFNLIWLELYYVLLHTVFCMILLLLYLYYGFNLILLVTQIYIFEKDCMFLQSMERHNNVKRTIKCNTCMSFAIIWLNFFIIDLFESVCTWPKIKPFWSLHIPDNSIYNKQIFKKIANLIWFRLKFQLFKAMVVMTTHQSRIC